jgi:hypothetical protein
MSEKGRLQFLVSAVTDHHCLNGQQWDKCKPDSDLKTLRPPAELKLGFAHIINHSQVRHTCQGVVSVIQDTKGENSSSFVNKRLYMPRSSGQQQIRKQYFYIVDNWISKHTNLWSEYEPLRNFFVSSLTVSTELLSILCWNAFTENFPIHSNSSDWRIEMSLYYENEVS